VETTKCKICGVFTNNLRRHLSRGRCFRQHIRKKDKYRIQFNPKILAMFKNNLKMEKQNVQKKQLPIRNL